MLWRLLPNSAPCLETNSSLQRPGLQKAILYRPACAFPVLLAECDTYSLIFGHFYFGSLLFINASLQLLRIMTHSESFKGQKQKN